MQLKTIVDTIDSKGLVWQSGKEIGEFVDFTQPGVNTTRGVIVRDNEGTEKIFDEKAVDPAFAWQLSELLKTEEFKNLEERTVRGWCEKGLLPADRRGRTWFVRPDDLRTCIATIKPPGRPKKKP